ncbi:MAG: CPBP family intramembrane metalloprotease [Anaerolineales bacterium]
MKEISTSYNPESSVLPFFGLVLGLLIPFWILGELFPVELLPGLPISALGAFTPAVAALMLSYKYAGPAGFLQLLQRSFDLRQINNKSWLIVIFLINPLIAISAYQIMRVTGVSLPNAVPLTLSVFPFFAVLWIAALGEELGWTGYVTDPLIERYGPLPASLLLGCFWTAIHFIPLLQVHRSIEWIAWWSLGTISYRLIMVWFYAHTGKSVFAAAIFHAMINLCWQLFPENGSHYDPRIFSLITFTFTIVLYATAQFLPFAKLQSNSERAQTASKFK